jgi:hypothetical protein
VNQVVTCNRVVLALIITAMLSPAASTAGTKSIEPLISEVEGMQTTVDALGSVADGKVRAARLAEFSNQASSMLMRKLQAGQSWREITVEIGVHPSVIGIEITDPRRPYWAGYSRVTRRGNGMNTATRKSCSPSPRKVFRARQSVLFLFIAGLNGWYPPATYAYPIDAYEKTGIGRLEYMRRVEEDLIKGTKQPKGAVLPSEEVDIRLLGKPEMELPKNDSVFKRQTDGLLGRHVDRYAVSVLDLSDVDNPRYAEINGEVVRNPGSVGKIVVALGLYQVLADLYPDDIGARWKVLRDTQIVADDFIISDHHPVRMWDRGNQKLVRRPLKIGDTGSMMEYMDWMISPSANVAAATLTKHGILLDHFGKDYPVGASVADDYFANTPRAELTKRLTTFIQAPVTRNGFDLKKNSPRQFFHPHRQAESPRHFELCNLRRANETDVTLGARSCGR